MKEDSGSLLGEVVTESELLDIPKFCGEGSLLLRDSLRDGHTSPQAASCFGQTTILARPWCQLAAAVTKTLTTHMQTEERPQSRRAHCWPSQTKTLTLRHGRWGYRMQPCLQILSTHTLSVSLFSASVSLSLSHTMLAVSMGAQGICCTRMCCPTRNSALHFI